MTKEERREYQERWRKDHPEYFKQYYLNLKAGKKNNDLFWKRIREIFRQFNQKVKGGKK